MIRHGILIPVFVGSNPTTASKLKVRENTMWLFGKNKKKINNKVVAESNPFVFGLEDYPWINSTNNELKLSAVYSAITTITATMSKIPFFVMNKKTKKRLNDENLYNLLNIAPNDMMSATKMNGLLATWLLYYGEAYALPIRKYRSNEIEKIIPFPHYNVSKYIDIANYKLYYELIFLDGHKERRSANEVVHYMFFTLDGINGISPLEYAKNTVQTGLNQDEYGQRVTKNYNRPLDYLKTQTDLSSKPTIKKGKDSKGNDITMSVKDVVREEWYKARKSESGGTAVLDNGLEYGTVPQITPDQMQFVTSKEVTVQDIARFFRMGSCMYKLGVGKQSYSSNEQAQICYINETIVPILRQWEQELTLKLLTAEQRKQGWQVKGNLNAELRGDTTARLAWYKGMKEMGVYNINEVRDYEDLEGIGNLGDVRTIGPNATSLEKAIQGTTAAEAMPNPISEEEENNDGQNDKQNNTNDTDNNQTA